MTTQTIDVAHAVSLALQRGLGQKLASVVLFGSRARGDAREDSDWDFLVIAHALPEDAFDRHLLMKQILPVETRGIASVLARTPNELETAFSALYLDIAADGVILFDQDHYINNRLDIIRQLTKDSGFVRQRSQAGDFWLTPKGEAFQQLTWSTKTHSPASQ